MKEIVTKPSYHRQSQRQAHVSMLGGIEFAKEIVDAMDLIMRPSLNGASSFFSTRQVPT